MLLSHPIVIYISISIVIVTSVVLVKRWRLSQKKSVQQLQIQVSLDYDKNCSTESQLTYPLTPRRSRSQSISVDTHSLSKYYSERRDTTFSTAAYTRSDVPQLIKPKTDSLQDIQASLEELLYILLQVEKTNNQFTLIFLATYTTFTTTNDLLSALINQFISNDRLRPRVVQVLCSLVSGFRSDLSDAHMCDLIGLLKHFESENMVTLCQPLRAALTDKLFMRPDDILFPLATTKLPVKKADFLSVPSVVHPRRKAKTLYPVSINWQDSNNNFDLLQWHPREIARQITFLEANLFCKIPTSDLLDERYLKDQMKTKAPALSNFISHFNKISLHMCSLIVSESEEGKRAILICYLIDLLDELVALKNFSSLMAIFGALQHRAVFRLSNTWDLVSDERKQAMKWAEELCDTKSKFKNMRAILADVAEDEPVIPYLGILLGDLSMIDGTNKSSVMVDDTELINFHKRITVSKVLSVVQTYQRRAKLYCDRIEAVPFLIDILDGMAEHKDDELYRKSLTIQPAATKKRRNSYFY